MCSLRKRVHPSRKRHFPRYQIVDWTSLQLHVPTTEEELRQYHETQRLHLCRAEVPVIIQKNNGAPECQVASLVDTGADFSSMEEQVYYVTAYGDESHDTLRKALKKRKCDHTEFMSMGGPVTVKGGAYVNIKIAGIPMKQYFHIVADGSDYDNAPAVILGMDFLKRTQSTIDLKNSKLVIQGRSIQMGNFGEVQKDCVSNSFKDGEWSSTNITNTTLQEQEQVPDAEENRLAEVMEELEELNYANYILELGVEMREVTHEAERCEHNCEIVKLKEKINALEKILGRVETNLRTYPYYQDLVNYCRQPVEYKQWYDTVHTRNPSVGLVDSEQPNIEKGPSIVQEPATVYPAQIHQS